MRRLAAVFIAVTFLTSACSSEQEPQQPSYCAELRELPAKLQGPAQQVATGRISVKDRDALNAGAATLREVATDGSAPSELKKRAIAAAKVLQVLAKGKLPQRLTPLQDLGKEVEKACPGS